MKKTFIAVCCILFLSFALHFTGVLAATTSYLAGFAIKAWGGGTYVSTLTKTIDGPERLYISSYFDRDLWARVVATSGNYIGDTDYYWYLTMNSGWNTHYLAFDMNAGATVYANFTGNKKLYLKTTFYWPDTTSVSGQWYANG